MLFLSRLRHPLVALVVIQAPTRPQLLPSPAFTARHYQPGLRVYLVNHLNRNQDLVTFTMTKQLMRSPELFRTLDCRNYLSGHCYELSTHEENWTLYPSRCNKSICIKSIVCVLYTVIAIALPFDYLLPTHYSIHPSSSDVVLASFLYVVADHGLYKFCSH